MALTKEQIKEFEEKEKEAKISDDLHEFQELADAIAEAGDKDWAKKIYKKQKKCLMIVLTLGVLQTVYAKN